MITLMNIKHNGIYILNSIHMQDRLRSITIESETLQCKTFRGLTRIDILMALHLTMS